MLQNQLHPFNISTTSNEHCQHIITKCIVIKYMYLTAPCNLLNTIVYCYCVEMKMTYLLFYKIGNVTFNPFKPRLIFSNFYLLQNANCCRNIRLAVDNNDFNCVIEYPAISLHNLFLLCGIYFYCVEIKMTYPLFLKIGYMIFNSSKPRLGFSNFHPLQAGNCCRNSRLVVDTNDFHWVTK